MKTTIKGFKTIMTLAFLVFTLPACAQQGKKKAAAEKEESGSHQYTNALIGESSPYLLEHAHNPVNWYPWGKEALEKAKKENKPIIISVGYAACHWCHVMRRESFSDTAVARIMNENFIAIKVDREERPDVDQIYMNAAQLITGSGGWPLNAFALPDGRPFFAGTYFPKEQWVELLKQIASVHKNEPAKVTQQAEALTQGIRKQEVITAPASGFGDFTRDEYQEIFQSWQPSIDYQQGGFNRAPKFPLPVGWEFLLQYHYLTGNEKALQAVATTLDAMARGGIYDQIGGGFARYSTDARWFAPHFEKMLYDNGQLVSLYAHAYQVTKKEAYAQVIRETLRFIEREMNNGEGGFYSSLNADSDGEEGKFYVWTTAEIRQALDDQTARLLIDYYQVSGQGNWEHGKNILHRKESKEAFAKKQDLSPAEWHKMLLAAKEKLLQVRSRRVRPSTDDKILTSWNALMLKGYVEAYLALGEEHYLETALKNARFLEKNMLRQNGRLWRNFKDGKASIDAFLDDYALLADAYISLYQATMDVHWLTRSRLITDYAVDHFKDEKSGMFFYTSDESENLIARKMELSDNVIPASNSVMAGVLFRLGEYYYHPSYIKMSKSMLHHVADDIPQGGPYYANWASLAGLMAYEPYEVAVMGSEALEKSKALQRQYLPTVLFMGGREENLPLLENKLMEGKTMIYVCRDKVCKLPVTAVDEALKQIATEW